jgi:hypothetical protein
LDEVFTHALTKPTVQFKEEPIIPASTDFTQSESV